MESYSQIFQLYDLGYKIVSFLGIFLINTTTAITYFTFTFLLLEKEMAIHSGTLAWKIPWMEKPDRLQSMGSQRVGHD